MKTTLFFATLIILLAASCKKQYECACTENRMGYHYIGTYNNPANSWTYETKDIVIRLVDYMTKKNARSTCIAESGSTRSINFDCTCDTYTLGNCVIVE